MNKFLEFIRADLIVVEEIWKKSELIVDCLGYVEEEENEDGDCIENYYGFSYRVDTAGASTYYDGMLKEIENNLQFNPSDALLLAKDILRDFGEMIEFIDSNRHKLCDECEPDTAIRLVNEMVLLLERVKGDLFALSSR